MLFAALNIVARFKIPNRIHITLYYKWRLKHNAVTKMTKIFKVTSDLWGFEFEMLKRGMNFKRLLPNTTWKSDCSQAKPLVLIPTLLLWALSSTVISAALLWRARPCSKWVADSDHQEKLKWLWFHVPLHHSPVSLRCQQKYDVMTKLWVK